tara:strand:- start:1410 stop:1652 length:243 start_codon:yes stop_codon:yes gene_type:complete
MEVTNLGGMVMGNKSKIKVKDYVMYVPHSFVRNGNLITPRHREAVVLQSRGEYFSIEFISSHGETKNVHHSSIIKHTDED